MAMELFGNQYKINVVSNQQYEPTTGGINACYDNCIFLLNLLDKSSDFTNYATGKVELFVL